MILFAIVALRYCLSSVEAHVVFDSFIFVQKKRELKLNTRKNNAILNGIMRCYIVYVLRIPPRFVLIWISVCDSGRIMQHLPSPNRRPTNLLLLHSLRFEHPFQILSVLFIHFQNGIVYRINKYILHFFHILWMQKKKERERESSSLLTALEKFLLWCESHTRNHSPANEGTRAKTISIIYFESLKLPFICKTG